MKKRAILILFTLALLCVLAVSVSAAPSTDPAVLNTVYEKAVQMTTDNVFGAGGTIKDVLCPYCNEKATWYALGAKTSTGALGKSGHYYLSGDLTANTGYYIPSGGNLCLHLNGHSIKSTNAYVIAGAVGLELNIMGDGSVQGAGNTANGAIFGQGTIRLFGGEYSRTAATAYTYKVNKGDSVLEIYTGTTISSMNSGYSAVHNGYSAAVLKMYGGTIDAKQGIGVTLSAGQFHQYDGTIKGAKRSNVIVSGGAYTLHDGDITAGSAMISGYATGGNVLLKSGGFTMEDGTISNGQAFEAGGNVYILDGTFTMKDGEIRGGTLYAANASRIGGGGVYIAGGTFDMQGGKVYSNAATSVNGGNVYIAGGELKLNTGAPAIQNGKATNGANIYMAAGTVTMDTGSVTQDPDKITSGGNVYMEGGQFNLNGTAKLSGGTGTHGGNLYIKGTGDFQMNGGSIESGVATEYGGNVYVFAGTMTVKAGTVTGGTAPNGGNISVYGGTLTVDGGTITKGTANSKFSDNLWYYNGGGNIYVADATGAKANILSGTVSDGTATNNSGGNILCRGGGALTVSGGTISGGKAGCPGGNIMNGASTKVTISGGTITGGEGNTGGSQPNEGDNIVSFGGTLTLSGGKVEANTDDLGNGILGYYNAKIILDGAPTVTNIYLAYNTGKDATLQVNSTFTGTAGVNFHGNHGVTVGKTLALDSSTGPYTGKVYIENISNITLYGTEDNKLQVAGTLANNTWYQNNDAAMAAIDGDATIKVYTSDALTLKGANYTVDLAGNSPVITGSGNLTCFDSANKNFKTFGTATVDGPTLVNTESTTQNGVLYYTVSDGNKHSFHILQSKVSSVSVRPASAGMYYSCTWNCDSTLLEMLKVDSYGVALSVQQWPTETFTNDGHTLYTKVEGVFEPNVKRNSVLVDKILKTNLEAEENNDRADRDIFAVPYVVIDGKTFIGTGVEHSLKDIMNLMDRSENYFANRVALENFYAKWISVMSSWNLTNIGKVPLDPAEDDTLKILMVGNSYCYYFAEELYALLDENKPAGINKVEVYNLYRGGCTLQEHYERWTGVQDSNYQLWKTDSSGRALQGGGYTTTLEEALILDNWDYISIQEGLSKFWFPAKEDVLAECKQYAEPIINRIRQIHPNATLMWHETWSQEIGFTQERDGKTYEVTDAAAQAAYEAKEKYVAVEMCKAYDLVRVNSGEAWIEARKSDLITNLCARLGVDRFPEGTANSGDGFHDGDIGGGQLMNAYVWYMTITGDTTVTDTQFRPKYTLAENVIAVLQAAAEAAIAAR